MLSKKEEFLHLHTLYCHLPKLKPILIKMTTQPYKVIAPGQENFHFFCNKTLYLHSYSGDKNR